MFPLLGSAILLRGTPKRKEWKMPLELGYLEPFWGWGGTAYDNSDDEE